MAYVQGGSSPRETSSSSDWEFYPGQQQGMVDDATYATRNTPISTEKPLSEQLEPIAVVGMGCRLPGSVSCPADFWKLIMSKGTGQTPKVPESRFNIDSYYHKDNDRPGSFHVMGGYFLDGTLQEFDPSFFGITPIEAMWMDPQQRKLLEVVYESFESAGVTLQEIAGSKTAVFAASFTADFQQMSFKEPSFRHAFAATGVDPGMISNRISHAFNLKGPSVLVNTACSSSIYAVHNACNALRNKECQAAVVCGVNLILTVDQHMNTAKLGVLSPTSTCHTFDESADGYGRAEGAGAVYLKRLSDAIRDGDPIRAVIRSSATNSNGKVPGAGITHPNRDGQVDVIKHAYHRGGNLDPCLTGFFECHGTGTAVGDPLEVHAVSLAMNGQRGEGKPLLIGAVKTNIGHSEAASGLAAVIKAVLVAERGVIPPTRGITKPNPKIQWRNWKVTTHNDAVAFPRELPVRRVSVNSFGYGGTNAHIIVEGADSLLTKKQTYKYVDPTTAMSRTNRVKMPMDAFDRDRPFLLTFSAHDKAALERSVANHARVSENYDLLDLSYTLANRRTKFPSRGYVVTSPGSQASATAAGSFEGLVCAENKKTPTIGFVFTGQGAQWPRMGAELMAYYPSFRRTIQLLDMTLGDLESAPEWTIEDALVEAESSSRVHEAEFAQPLTTAIQIALVQLLRAWGVRPAVTVGHSSGEIAAAYAAGYISASDAIVMAHCRGQAVRDVNMDGAMMAVGVGAEAVEPYLAQLSTAGSVSVACHNSPSGVTVSGDATAIDELKDRLTKDNIFARVVKTGGKAYHSSHMIPASEEYERLVRASKASLLPFDLPLETDARMVSSVTNRILPQDAVLDEAYFSGNLRKPVLFNQAVQTILTASEFEDVNLFVEIGPHSAMSGPIRQIKAALGVAKLEYLPTLLRDHNCATEVLRLAGDLFIRDYNLDLERVTSIEESLGSGKVACKQGSLIVDLPPYPWSTKQFWAESRHSIEQRQLKYPRHDILGSLIPGASLSEPTWRNVLRIRDVPWLKDHSLGGEAVFPAAAYFSMAMEAITQITELGTANVEISNYVLRDVSIKKALVTPDDDNGVEVMLNMRPAMSNTGEPADAHSWWDFNVSSIDQDGVAKDHMTGSIAVNAREVRPKPSPAPDSLTRKASGKEWNRALRAVGFDYGPTFADMTDIGFNGRDYVCTCKTTAKTTAKTETGDMMGESRHVLHPATVDSCLQLMIASIYAGRTKAMRAGAVPIQVDEVTVWKPTASQLAGDGHATAVSFISERGVRSFNGGSELVANDGQLLMEIRNIRCTLYEAAIPQTASESAKSMSYGEMVWRPDVESLSVAGEMMPVAEYLELAAFKDAGIKVLDVGGTQATAILTRLPDLTYTAAVANPDILGDVISQCKNAKVIRWDGEGDLAELGLETDAPDIVVLPASLDKELGPFQECRTLLLLNDRGCVVEVVSNPTPRESSTRPEMPSKSDIQLVYRNTAPNPLSSLVRSFQALGRAAVPVRLLEMVTVHDHVVVLDLGKPMLADLDAEEFAAIQRITNEARTLLWVSDGGIMEGTVPEAAMAPGLMRSIRAEQATINIVTVDFDRETTSDEQVTSWVSGNAVRQMSSEGGMETEYCVSHGTSFICRLVPHDRINNTIQTGDSIEPVSFTENLRMRGTFVSGKLVFEAVPDEAADTLDPDAVEVQVRFAGLNKEGVLAISGSDYTTDFSQDIGGVVVRVGSAVVDLAVGDSVVGFNLDGFRSYQTVSASMLQKVNPKESLMDLTAMILPYCSALYGLKRLANVQKGESVLILQGTGFGGAAAIDLSTALGAIPYVVAADLCDATRIMEVYGLTRQQVLSSAEEVHSFLGSGVDVVYGSGWSPHWLSREAWRSIAPSGRFVDTGRKKVLHRQSLDMVPFHRGASYCSYDIVDMIKRKPDTVSELLAETIRLNRHGRIAMCIPPQNVNIAELDDAVARFSDDFASARTVAGYEASGMLLQMLPPSVELVEFSSQATYLLVGCLGGLGRSLTSWMMRNGAQNFCFLSRSGADADRAAALVSDLEAAGADVLIIRGDASVPGDVQRAVASIPADRPLRGVVQAAMVLRDGMFYSMSFEDWQASIRPKVHGTANLHDALADTPLDFFLMTSSVSGILGTPGQANYAAANSFLDALACHRRSRGQNACAAIVPMVLGVGVVAENEDLEDALTRKGMYGIDEEHLLRSLEIAIREQQRPKAEGGIDHLVIGLDPRLLADAMNSAGASEAFWMADPRFRTLAHHLRSGPAAGGSGGLLASLLAAVTGVEAVVSARGAIEDKLGRMLLLDADAFGDLTKAVVSYGIDSMIGAELRNWLFNEFGLDIPFQQLLGPSLTPTKLAEQICASHGVTV